MTTITKIKETCCLPKSLRFHDLDSMIDFLKENGKRIGEQAKRGNKKAEDIVRWYDFLYRAPGDPGGQVFLAQAINDYVGSINEADLF